MGRLVKIPIPTFKSESGRLFVLYGLLPKRLANHFNRTGLKQHRVRRWSLSEIHTLILNLILPSLALTSSPHSIEFVLKIAFLSHFFEGNITLTPIRKRTLFESTEVQSLNFDLECINLRGTR